MNDDVIEMEGKQPEQQQATAIVPRAEQQVAVAQTTASTPMDLLRIVTERGASVEQIGQFMDLMERQQKNEARQAFVRAMAAFKRNPPDIYKDKAVDFTSSKGRTYYMHATLGNICEQIIGALADHGISHSWDVQQPTPREVMVTCILTHEMGHSERVQFKAGADDTGNKNPIQQMASAITYCQRYTLLSACGIAVKDGIDDDGAGAAAAEDMRQDANKRRSEPAAPQLIGKKGLQAAIDSILAGNYKRDALERDYKLTEEQAAHVDSVLGKKGSK